MYGEQMKLEQQKLLLRQHNPFDNNLNIFPGNLLFAKFPGNIFFCFVFMFKFAAANKHKYCCLSCMDLPLVERLL